MDSEQRSEGMGAAQVMGEAVVDEPVVDGPVWLWRGLRHEWLRTVLGFRTPHRISRLDSHVSSGADGAAAFHFAQAAGVDGNYMQPVGYHASARAPGVVAVSGGVRFAWTDEVEGGTQRAQSALSGTLEVALEGPALGALAALDGAALSTAAVLGGFRLRSACDDGKQPGDCPCNSDGLWPYRMAFEVGACAREGGVVRVPVGATLHRAWTPNRGGVPPIDIKPLNVRLDLALEVRVVVLLGAVEALRVTRGPALRTRAPARRAEASVVEATLQGAAGYPVGLGALTGFGFELVRTGRRAKHRHLGRYIGGMRFHVEDGAYDAQAGALTVRHTSQLWVPRTVVATDAAYTMQSALVQLGPGATAQTNREARATLCFNSTAQAPLYSRWCKCGEPGKGPERSEASVALS